MAEVFEQERLALPRSIVTDTTVGPLHGRGPAEALGLETRSRFPGGETHKNWATIEEILSHWLAPGSRPERFGHGHRRRNRHRHGGVCRRHLSQRRLLGRGPHHSPGDGRCRHRRQDRGQPSPGQEPGRFVLAPAARHRRHRNPRHPSRARTPGRPRRGRQGRVDQRPRTPGTPARSRRKSATTRSDPTSGRPWSRGRWPSRPRSSTPTSARPVSARPSTSVTPWATPSKPPPDTSDCSTVKRWPGASRPPPSSADAAGCSPPRASGRSERLSTGSVPDPASPTSTPRRSAAYIAVDKKRDADGIAWVLPTDDGVVLDQRVETAEAVEVLRELQRG